MYKLYTNRLDHFLFYIAKISADYCGLPVEVVVIEADSEKAQDKEWKDKKGSMSFPILEDPSGVMVSESCAIAAFIARESGHPGFLPTNAW